MTVVDQEGVFIGTLPDWMTGRIDRLLKLLLELNRQVVLQGSRAPAASLALDELEMSPDQYSSRSQELYVAVDPLWLPAFSNQDVINFVLPDSADALLDQSRHVEEHSPTRIRAGLWSVNEAGLFAIRQLELETFHEDGLVRIGLIANRLPELDGTGLAMKHADGHTLGP